MGAGNVGLVLVNWRHLPDRPHRLLVAMAYTALDKDEPPRYFAGRDAMALALGLDVPDPALPDTPDAEEIGQRRARAFKVVATTVRKLREAGAVTTMYAANGARSEHHLHLIEPAKPQPRRSMKPRQRLLETTSQRSRDTTPETSPEVVSDDVSGVVSDNLSGVVSSNFQTSSETTPYKSRSRDHEAGVGQNAEEPTTAGAQPQDRARETDASSNGRQHWYDTTRAALRGKADDEPPFDPHDDQTVPPDPQAEDTSAEAYAHD